MYTIIQFVLFVRDLMDGYIQIQLVFHITNHASNVENHNGNMEIKNPPPNIQVVRMQIRSAPNAGKVLIGRKQSLLASFEAISGKLFYGSKT